MRVPFSWMREYCDPGLEVDEVAELLSMRAVEVERVIRVGAPSPQGFVVGLVLSAEQHPNADRLSVCEVDTGEATRTIVCGAPNVAAGQTVPVALPGAVLPGGRQLGRAKLRGVVSDGMILSETELEVGDDAAGIMVLGDGAAAGTPLADVLPISESVLDLELNPNRSDCLGVYGVARELHAITGAPLAPAPWSEDAEADGDGEVGDYASVSVEVPELCPRFTARAFSEVAIGPSPAWLKARLVAAGQRPISNVVDITNYVMLMTAQPLHAFDLDRLPGGEVIVRRARDGETMTTLDGVERTFDRETVLVCDRDRPSGIAGIMGGQVSEVSAETTRVLLEVATWDGVNILRTSSMLGLRSEASTRFEKQLHPELAIRGQRIASRLIVELCGARLLPGTIDEAAEIPAPHAISLHGARLDSLLGVHVDREEAIEHLERLEFEVEPDGEDDLRATVPVHRHYDVTREADLVEEVGRLHGFDRLPRTLPEHADRVGGLSREQALRRRAEDAMRDLGACEIVSWSLAAPDLPDRLRLPEGDPRRDAIATDNPLTAEQVAMRTSLVGGLLDAARHNLARDADRVLLFESGRAYLRAAGPAEGGELAGAFAGELPPPACEPHRIGCLAVGAVAPTAWRREARPVDFYDAKGLLEALCSRLGAPLELVPASEPFLHPGRTARIAIDGRESGWVGELHPLVAREWDLPGGAGFEVDLAPLVAASRFGRERYEDVTTYPAVLQDLAVVVAEDVPAERVRAAVLEGGDELLADAELFDLYRGEQVGEGRKSLALRLEFRAPDRTLTDDDVAERREAIKRALAGIGGSLRE
ncbi:MAG TPA: phenylalanine--tRNA ligase subunit beta [Solirubrobacterales bacterium]|nr:phenylalanine--tRNA ligase subunit beta [Solirubrobacterales bacterium]